MDRAVAAQQKALLGRVLRDRWTLDALLGCGGMATVYAATHRNGSRGAIKVLHAEYAAVPEIRTRLVREGYLVNRIKHRGVVRIIDDDVTEEGWPYLVMELLCGRTLKERWIASDRKLPLGEALRIGEAVLDILAAAHEERVVHRDVKPDNVFLTDDGEVRLLDFGIARFKEAAMDATQTGAMLGTPAFMAPEQALAHWDEVDARSDVFAVGATLWTVLTNRLIHPSKTVPEALIAAATKHARPFASVVPSAPPELTHIIDRALAFDRADRFQDAAKMRDAIASLRSKLDGDATREALAIDAPPIEDSIAPRPVPQTSTEIMAPLPTPVRQGLPRRIVMGAVIAGSIVAAVYAGRWWAKSQADVVSPPLAPSTSSARADEAMTATPSATSTNVPVESASPRTTATPSGSGRRAVPTSSAGRELPPFDAVTADRLIRAATSRAAISCRGLGTASISILLRFTADGSSTARHADLANESSRLGQCVHTTMSGIVVPAFSGPPQEIGATITVR